MNQPLHVAYRPKSFKGVIGQDTVVEALQRLVENKATHLYLLHGPSGTGKTTLARICARALGAKEQDIIEVDGATNTGIDNMRQLQEAIRYKPLSGGAVRIIIVDECHRVSGNAFDSLLKATEEPPAHLYWFLCTTVPTKVPLTIRNRAQQFALKELEPDKLVGLLTRVATRAGLQVPTDVIDYIASKSLGSPRRALVNLERAATATSAREAAKLLEQVVDEDKVIDLVRFICTFQKSRPWPKAMELLEKIGDADAEGIRMVTLAYLGSCLKGAKTNEQALPYLQIMEAFAEPYNQGSGKAMLTLSIGRALLT